MEIMTIEQVGKRRGVTPRRVSELCRSGQKICGAFQLNCTLLREAAETAADELRRSLEAMRMNVTIKKAKTLGLLEI